MYINEPEIRDAVAILGTDDTVPEAGAMLYFGIHNISREYRWAILSNVFMSSRDAPAFLSKCCTPSPKMARASMREAMMSCTGRSWGPDLQLTCNRVS
jgi:hypothetical protein